MLSIVVPAHGVPALLPGCLDSLLHELPDAVEIVAVNDASPDACGRIIDDYSDRYDRVRPLHLTCSNGPGPARNAGITLARGEYLWFVDADDLVPPGAVAAVVARLRQTRPDLLLVGNALLREDGLIEADPTSAAGEWTAAGVTASRRPSLLRTRQAAWNRIVARSLLTRAGVRFPPGWYEDVTFSYLVLLAASSVSSLGAVAYLYRQGRAGAITSTPSERHFEVFNQYEALFDRCDRWLLAPPVRAWLFARMIEHYLVILGAENRLPPQRRMAFFTQASAHYRRYLPAGGYPAPAGINGLKHRFIRWDSYEVFTLVRNVYRAGRWVRSGNLSRRPTMRENGAVWAQGVEKKPSRDIANIRRLPDG
jgi:glycosyltransferase involved in cell wall biosynthesis